MSSEERYRLVVLGPGKVGKTAIIRRFLNDAFSERYKETVEDIYSRDFNVRGSLLPLDIYDTNFYYPDMRKVIMASANAFILAFAVDDVCSFKSVTELHDELTHKRADFRDLPLVIVGNKSDLPDKKLLPETVHAWSSRLSSPVEYLEVSAKTNHNISQIFSSLLQQSGFPFQMKAEKTFLTPAMPRRNLSVRAKSPSRSKTRRDSPSPPRNDDASGLARMTGRAMNLAREGGKGLTRHGSLMRKSQRLSLKIKHVEADGGDDCKIS